MNLNSFDNLTVAIDAWFAADSSPRGIGKVTKGFLEKILDDQSKFFIIFTPKKTKFFLEIMKRKNCKVIVLDYSYPIYEQVMIPFCCYKYRIHLLHSLANTSPIFLPSMCQRLITIHDVIFMQNKMVFHLQKRNFGSLYRCLVLRLLNKKNLAIHFISQFTANAYSIYFSEPRNSVIAHNGLSEDTLNAAKKRKTEYSAGDYLFALGAEDPRKNTKELIQLFMENLYRWPNLKLVIAGVKDTGKFLHDNDLTSEELVNHKIELLSYIPEKMLYNLYTNAKAFLFLSSNEGFGLPIIEAQLFGAKCIVSNNSSCVEVAGPDALLVNPNFKSEIITAILSITRLDLSETEHRIKWAKHFTWVKTAKIIGRFYEEITDRRTR